MTHLAAFDSASATLPLIAIMRGVRPDEVEAIGDALVETGFEIIDVPINSPDPLDSIARRLDGRAVARSRGRRRRHRAARHQVAGVAAAGSTPVISPNAASSVIAAAVAAGLVPLPGIAAPSEAFAALDAGAAALKLFPAEAASPGVLKTMRAVLPANTRVLPVGGIAPDTKAPWPAAGAAGFGLGSALYTPRMTACEVGERARRFVAAFTR